VVLWALEYAQLRKNGQTIGYKAMGLTLENEDGRPLSECQIIKRMAYRDTISTFDYLKDRQAFEQQHGQRLPHDSFAGIWLRECRARVIVSRRRTRRSAERDHLLP